MEYELHITDDMIDDLSIDPDAPCGCYIHNLLDDIGISSEISSYREAIIYPKSGDAITLRISPDLTCWQKIASDWYELFKDEKGFLPRDDGFDIDSVEKPDYDDDMKPNPITVIIDNEKEVMYIKGEEITGWGWLG